MKNCKTCKHLSVDYTDECQVLKESALDIDLEETGYGHATVDSVAIVNPDTFWCSLHMTVTRSETEGAES